MRRSCLALACLACGGEATGLSLDAEGQPAPPALLPPYAASQSGPSRASSKTSHPPSTSSGGGASFGSSTGTGGSRSGTGGSGGGAGESSRGGGTTSSPGGGAGGTGASAEPAPHLAPAACNTLRQLDPDEVYLIGTLAEGACGQDALTHWSNPNLALTGFGCYNSSDAAIIRPSDDALLISDSIVGVTVFHEDACVTREQGSFGNASNPTANDGQLASPCALSPSFVGQTLELAPSGAAAHWCGASWLSSAGHLLYSGPADVLAYDGERLLTRDGVFDIAQQTMQRLIDLPEAPVLTSRVTSDGFWLALQGEPRAGATLWHVARDGRAEQVGAYPSPPADASIAYSARLAADGALFQLANHVESGILRDLIVRRSLFGGSEVVYDEGHDPLVKIHVSGLVTGP